MRRLTTEEFIERARKLHGDKYDYSLVEYTRAIDNVRIICPKHGEFLQTPDTHLHSNGCSRCSGENIPINIKRKPSKEELIRRAKEVHGEKYDYSKVEYVNSKTKIKIICPIHGEFEQRANDHLRGQGCPKCADEHRNDRKKLTKDIFIERAQKIHKNKYDYSLVNFSTNKDKVTIICPEHGPFEQAVDKHINARHGCPKCAPNYKLTREDFLERAREVHGEKYDYSLIVYKGVDTKVKIICPEHGAFEQSPYSHVNRGFGCPKCSGRYMDTEYFIEKAKLVHGDKYDYNLVKYVDNKSKVCIICPKHGEFWQTSSRHLSGAGCPKCASIESPEEILTTNRLKERFPEFNIETQYNNDERYPFKCDIYVSELDLFIELNIFWTHDDHWFDKSSLKDREQLEFWSDKKTEFYDTAIETWTKRDVKKRETARKNKLNYVTLWNKQDIEDWFNLGCPVGQDWKREYSWKQKTIK